MTEFERSSFRACKRKGTYGIKISQSGTFLQYRLSERASKLPFVNGAWDSGKAVIRVFYMIFRSKLKQCPEHHNLMEDGDDNLVKDPIPEIQVYFHGFIFL